MKKKQPFPVFKSFDEAMDARKHVAVPADWSLYLCDVENSTAAIEQGNYKHVTLVGASAIMAVCNAVRREQVHYLFGGDGATFFAPPDLSGVVTSALLASQRMAESVYGLHLRVGRIPISELKKEGCDTRIAGYQMSKTFVQPVFSGSGILAAEKWIRDPVRSKQYLLRSSPVPEVGYFQGLECRWEPLESERGEILSLIIMSRQQNPVFAARTYQEVLAKIESIYRPANPVNLSKLNLNAQFVAYTEEATIAEFRHPKWRRFLKAVVNYALTQSFSFLWNTVLKQHGDNYRNELVANSDFRKFDGMLRMVLDGNKKQHAELEGVLESKALKGELVYGMHRSDSALMTCLIFNRSKGEHLHLVDGADGGYTKAANQLKEKLKSIREPRKRSA